MISQSNNRVQAIKSKFENLNNENAPFLNKKPQLCKQKYGEDDTKAKFAEIKNDNIERTVESDSSSDDFTPKPNQSYLYSKGDVKRSYSETKSSLSRQTSDPGKKLHRSHAFRCDRSQISPKRHDSCNGRSETSGFTLKSDKKLSKERLKQLGNFLEVQMKKDNFVSSTDEVIMHNSVPDDQVPSEILDQYAKVNKAKKKDEKSEAMTDSGVSSETENLEDDKSGRIKKLMTQFEKTDVPVIETKTNLDSMDELAASSETMKLERKNPHLILTDTLKKALKQPLPTGPPPKKPPRTFIAPIPENPDKPRKDPKIMLKKLEQVLERRKTQNHKELSPKPKEMHYLCTEILDIAQRSLTSSPSDPISRCFNSLNCTVGNSMSSLPYTRLSTHMETESENMKPCSCINEKDLTKLTLKEPHDTSTKLLIDTDSKCSKCLRNDTHDGFKCHLTCKCVMERSKFYVDEHIYDEPYIGDDEAVKRSNYGSLNLKSKYSKSLEDLRDKDQTIYEIPTPTARSTSPASSSRKIDFEKLLKNFENGFSSNDNSVEKPAIETITEKSIVDKSVIEKSIKLKPLLAKINVSKSTENLMENGKFLKKTNERKCSTETKRYRNRCETGSSIGLIMPKKENAQLDVDKENLNRLMIEIYETVTAACNMEGVGNKPGSFPTEQCDADGSTSEDSIKLTRSLTEKRKNYVRRVSSRVAYLDPKIIRQTRFRHQTSICSYKSDIVDNPYSTFRSWKSFRHSQSNLSKDRTDMSTDSKFNLTDSTGNILSMRFEMDKLSIDEKAGCLDIEMPLEARESGLFNLCMLVGLNYMTGQAYVKNVFPGQAQIPPHIENLVFPETLSSASRGEWSADSKGGQCYSLVLTDERGERSYGYCRRVLPEGATACLPLCYCIIGRYRAPGFYYKVLQEIESHHGSSEVEINSILQQLFETDFPRPGEEVTVTYHHTKPTKEMVKCKTLPDMRSGAGGSEFDYYDLENNNEPRKVLLSFEGHRTKTMKRPIEPRVDEDNLSTLLDLLGAGLVIKVFGSLLLERKVIIIGDQLSAVSSCLEALQSSLYPFVWQQPLISAIPSEIQTDVLEAPLPILAGMLKANGDLDVEGILFEEGMLIDLTHPSKVLFCQSDESTILPTSSYKTLKTSLQMESSKHKDKHDDTKTRNVMISEAFMRFFVDILDGYWRFFKEGSMKDGDMGKDGAVFDKEAFKKSATSKQNQFFLEWFTETAMFNHFVQNMALKHLQKSQNGDANVQYVDAPLPDFYHLFDDRISNVTRYMSKNMEGKNYKSAMNKKVKMLKNKLRDLVA